MIRSQELAESFYSIVQETEAKDIDFVFDAFVRFLEENRFLAQLPTIVRYLESYKEKDQLFKTFIIETPFPINTSLQEHIRNYVVGEKKPTILVKENKALIGGFKTTFQGSVTDASVAYNLQVLKTILTK